MPRRISLEVNQSSVAAALARAGAGVAVIDPFLLMDERDHGVVIIRLSPPTLVKAQVLVPPGSVLSRPAQALLNAMVRTSKRRGDLPVDA